MARPGSVHVPFLSCMRGSKDLEAFKEKTESVRLNKSVLFFN